jgi:hypothetical protein
MKDFNTEELKTAIGHLMLDLRGNWDSNYQERMELVADGLRLLLDNEPENLEYKSDLAIMEGEICVPHDGRIFRDSCNLYGYSSIEGRNQKVYDFLQGCLTLPDYYFN